MADGNCMLLPKLFFNIFFWCVCVCVNRFLLLFFAAPFFGSYYAVLHFQPDTQKYFEFSFNLFQEYDRLYFRDEPLEDRLGIATYGDNVYWKHEFQ